VLELCKNFVDKEQAEAVKHEAANRYEIHL
jgi:hypothetical protein